MDVTDLSPVLDACTLPTPAQPLRIQEWQGLFATGALGVERLGAYQVRIALRPTPEVAAAAGDLTVRETECCSFFTFALTASAGALHLDVTVPPSQAAVLTALTGWAERAGAPA